MKSTQLKFADEIERTIDYFRKEFDLTYFDAIGVLTYMATHLSLEVHERADEEENDEEENDEEDEETCEG